jgi:hypothetical protein
MTAITAKTPTPDFNSPSEPCTVLYASESDEPTTGTRLEIVNLIAFEPTLSSPDEITCLNDNTAVKIPKIKPNIHFDVLDIKRISPLSETFDATAELILSPKNSFNSGEIISALIRLTACPAILIIT